MSSIYIAWFVTALILIIIEINIMSFYLMALALGALAGGIAAWMDGTFTAQAMTAGIVTIIAASLSFVLRKKLRTARDKSNNVLDIGQRVTVQPASIREDGSARVTYRGAQWEAFASEGPVSAGIWIISAVNGTQLILGQKVCEYPSQNKSDTLSSDLQSVNTDQPQGQSKAASSDFPDSDIAPSEQDSSSAERQDR